MLMSGLIIFGTISMLRMGISQMPDVDFPVLSINATMKGAAPTVMETEIVDILEDAVMAVAGVRTITSTSRDGGASITVEFDLTRDINVALQEVQTRIASVQRLLPPQMDPVTISKSNPDDQPIMWVAVSSVSTPLRDIMTYVRDQLKDQFTTVSDVGDVFLGGYVEPDLRVWVSARKLAARDLAISDVIGTIDTEHQEVPAGRIENPQKEFNIRTMGEAASPEEFSEMYIGSRGGSPNYHPIPLKDVARVELGLEDIRRISRSRGKSAVGMGILKQRGANAVQVAANVRVKIAAMKKVLPKDVEINVVNDSTRFIRDSVSELKFTLLLSALLTGLVCWAFLGSWSSTFNVFMSIPTSVLGTFIILYFAGFTLNTFTLLGLSLSIGIVVDDAIMVLENIVRHQEHGEDRITAAINGAQEITFAAIAASVSIVAIFLPVAFMSGVIGKFFFQFGVTISGAIMLSLVEALTLTPMRCSQFVSVGQRQSRFGHFVDGVFEGVSATYRQSLGWVLHATWSKMAVVLFAIAVFLTSTMYCAGRLRKEMVPPMDQSMFLMSARTAVGSSLEFTDGKIHEAEAYLLKRAEIANLYAAVGGFGGDDASSGNLFVTLKPKGERGKSKEIPHEPSQAEIMGLVRSALSKVKDARFFILDLSSRGFSSSRGFPVEMTVQGPDWDKLAEYSGQVMKGMEKTGLMLDIDTNYRVGMPEIQVTPDRIKAQERGVSIGALGQVIEASMGGIDVAKYTQGGHRYNVRLQLSKDEREDAEAIKGLLVRNNRGELVRIGDIVHVKRVPTLQLISRLNRERAITLTANIKPGVSQQKALDAAMAAAAAILPPGYHAALTGSAQASNEAFSGLLLAMVLGFLVAYMVLASQFNSFLDPSTVFVALPFSISGAFVALMIAGQSLNLYSMIGLILLMGIVKKNSILLVDFTNQIRDRAGKKHTVREGLLQACPIRLRPILMTSFATIAGALPAALSFGPGAEARAPMAVSVIGGVLLSTLLTLYVVPCVYVFFEWVSALVLGDHRWAPEPKAAARRGGSMGGRLRRGAAIATPAALFARFFVK